MGDIKKLLAMGEISPRQLTANTLWTDLCENIHLHYRNIRLDFSEKEFAIFRAAIHHLGMAVEYESEKNQYEEGDLNFLDQQIFNTHFPSDSEYYPNRVTIEYERDHTVHFHYRDLRLHWLLEEFNQIADMFIEAKQRLNNLKDFPYKDIQETITAWIDIDLIQPYDKGHKPMCLDKDHKDGIEYVKKLILDGKKILPILINSRGQRLDGFKRYMAAKELGHTKIECIVDPYGVMGGQHNQNLLAGKE